MTPLDLAVLSFPVLLLLIFLRMPIGLAMALCGLGGAMLVLGAVDPVLNQLKQFTYTTFANYSLSIIPLFLLMGQFAAMGGLSQALFKAAEAWIGHRKGGVAIAAVGACAGFGAISGSSLATAATMGQVALPELRRAGYAGGISTATLAAGGTLGILIPPSVVLVIYALLTEQNIAHLFVAALIPGIIAAIGYMLVIAIYVRLKPESAGSIDPVPMKERWKATFKVWPVLVIFAAVVGGIYTGLFTPTEAAAVGAFGTGIAAWAAGGLNRRTLRDALLGTAISTGMIFMIVLGAGLFNTFLALSQLPQELARWVLDLGISPLMVLVVILLIYLLLGCVMDSLSMILLTVPIFFPVMMALDFGMTPTETAIWFGILVLIVVEVGLITPPVGMNLFIINNLARNVPIMQTYKAVIPFVISDLFRTALLVAFPPITLFLIYN